MIESISPQSNDSPPNKKNLANSSLKKVKSVTQFNKTSDFKGKEARSSS